MRPRLMVLAGIRLRLDLQREEKQLCGRRPLDGIDAIGVVHGLTLIRHRVFLRCRMKKFSRHAGQDTGPATNIAFTEEELN